jgi:hypothetical protein
MQAYEGGWVTRARLACARGVLWMLWEIGLLNVRLFLNKQHPFRVYIEGDYKKSRQTHLASLRVAAFPRTRLITRWKLGAAAATLVAATALAIPGETEAIAAFLEDAHGWLDVSR